MDAGLVVTGVALGTLLYRPTSGLTMRFVLALTWLTSCMTFVLGMPKSDVVFSLIAADLMIIISGMIIIPYTNRPARCYVTVMISVFLMPFHLVMSGTTGNLNWTLYAASLNTGFVLQCLVMSGGFDGVGGIIRSRYNRFLSGVLRDR